MSATLPRHNISYSDSRIMRRSSYTSSFVPALPMTFHSPSVLLLKYSCPSGVFTLATMRFYKLISATYFSLPFIHTHNSCPSFRFAWTAKSPTLSPHLRARAARQTFASLPYLSRVHTFRVAILTYRPSLGIARDWSTIKQMFPTILILEVTFDCFKNTLNINVVYRNSYEHRGP